MSADPWTSQFPRMFAGLCCIYRDDFEHARGYLEDVVEFADANGAATLATPARGLLGAALIGMGEMNQGMVLLEHSRAEFEQGDRPWGTVQAMYLIGRSACSRGEAGCGRQAGRARSQPPVRRP